MWELAEAIMEAEICHCMPPNSWRTRKTVGIIQSKSEGLRTRQGGGGGGQGSLRYKSCSPKVREIGSLLSESRVRWMSQVKKRERIWPSSAFSIWTLRGLVDGCWRHRWESILLTQSTDPEMFYQLSGYAFYLSQVDI